MNIIRPGDLSLVETTRRFACDACGCVWDASPAEYVRVWDRNDELVACNCPTCRKRIYMGDYHADNNHER